MGLSEIFELVFSLAVLLYAFSVQKYIKALKNTLEKTQEATKILLNQNKVLSDAVSNIAMMSQVVSSDKCSDSEV